MNFKRVVFLIITIMGMGVIFSGCGDSTNSLAAFQPEIINNVDDFSFQITDADNVTTTVTYSLQNTGTQVSIDQSPGTTAGSASISILDANGTEVYQKDLSTNGNFQSSNGTAGTWSIVVDFQNYIGTMNFRVQKTTP